MIAKEREKNQLNLLNKTKKIINNFINFITKLYDLIMDFKNFDSNFKIFTPIFLAIFIFALLASVYFIYKSPIDYQQSNAVYIMYIHVPAAWMALFIYTIMACLNLSAFVWKNPFFYVISRNIASTGAIFCIITLITGSLWGKPIWGTYWAWDPRLTSMLILFFLYCGYIVTIDAFDNQEKGQKIAAIISIIGFINIPLIKFSVEYFNSLHQPASVFRKDGVSIERSMFIPLMTMFLTYFSLFIFIALIKIKTEILTKKIIRNKL